MYERSEKLRTYGYLWEKYRPAILSLMTAAADSPQTYQFSNHEFKDISKKSSYSFVLRVFEGKAQNDIKRSNLAQDLLYMLQNSGRASELASAHAYEFELDRNFVLHIRREPEVESV